MARKWLGSRSATKNASATGPAPRIAASMMSRANPVSRESSVYPPTVKMRPSIRRFYRIASRRKTTKSVRKRGAHSLDAPLLGRFIQIGVHRQADDLGRQLFAARKASGRDRKIQVRGLLMQRLRIIDRGRNAMRLQRRSQRIAASIRQPYGVLRPYRRAIRRHAWHDRNVPEAGIVTPGG